MSVERTRICVLVSGGGTNLQALLDAEKDGRIPSGHIVLVGSNNPNAYALTRATEHGVDSFVFRDEAVLLDRLKAADIEMIVLAGFLKILSADFIRAYEDRIINIHPALIPSFCGKGCYGLHVHEKALDYGVKVTGATVHYVNEIPDGGRIIAQKAVYIQPDDTPESLQRRVMEQAEWILLPEATEQVAAEIRKGRE
jgi:phosphoribosylglycinamide formyltransferase-1